MESIIFQDGGALSANSLVYIERIADQQARQCLYQMEYLTIFEPRQQGKTSLINHLIGFFRPQGYVLPYVDLTTLNKTGEAAWYTSLCNRLLRKLEFISLANRPTIPTNGSSWFDFLEDIAKLAESASCYLIFALDEVGAVPPTWATDFFTAIRMVFNGRTDTPAFERLTFILAGAYHPEQLIKNSNISPFNVAHPILLADFEVSQIQQLAAHLPLVIPPETAAQRLHYWTGGQPFLCQRLCRILKEQGQPVTRQAIDKAAQQFIREDTNHLPHLKKQMNANPELLKYARIIILKRSKIAPNLEESDFQLAHIIGLISADEQGCCRIRNHIYELAFAELIQPPTPLVVPPPLAAPPPQPRPISLQRGAAKPEPTIPSLRRAVPLKLQLTPQSEGAFRVQVQGNDAQGTPWDDCQLPYSEDDLLAILKALRRPRYQSGDFTETQQAALERLGLLRAGQFSNLPDQVGQTLHRALLGRRVYSVYDRLHHEVSHKPDFVLVQMRFDEKAVGLARCPWELLFDDRFLLHSREVELARYISYADPPPNLTITPPFRLLYIEARPSDASLEPLPVGDESAKVRQALAPLETAGLLQIDTLRPPTFDALRTYLNTQSLNMIHFDGHGLFARCCSKCQAMNYAHYDHCQAGGCNHSLVDEPQGYLAFEHGHDPIHWITSRLFSSLLNKRPDLGLVVLSACRSSHLGGEHVFGSTAPALIQSGIPAVVAMQLPITVESAAAFMAGFYKALARFESLPAAVNAGRQAIMETDEWFIPTLYLRSRDDEGYLFRRKEH